MQISSATTHPNGACSNNGTTHVSKRFVIIGAVVRNNV
jgi:hypothetical protein